MSVLMWQGSILTDQNERISDLHLISDHAAQKLPVGDLNFLALVDPSRIPFHMICGPILRVETGSDVTQNWFSQTLLEFVHYESHGGPDIVPWHSTNAIQSDVGILVRPQSLAHDTSQVQDSPRITELLFIAQRSYSGSGQPLTPPPSSPSSQAGDQEDRAEMQDDDEIALYAIPLSADMLYQAALYADLAPLTPGEAQFLPDPKTYAQAQVESKKRERIVGLFDSFHDKQREAKRRRKQSLSFSKAESAGFNAHKLAGNIKLEHSGTTCSASEKKDVKHIRTLSRSSSATSSRPEGGVLPRPESKRSSLSQALNVDIGNHDDSVEARNKQMISRMVMTGMRLYGYEQKRRIRADPASLPADSAEEDFEYKAIYHQTYKAAAFALRTTIATESCKTEALQELVDKLLSIFCAGPGRWN